MTVLHRLPTPEHGCQGVELYSNGPDLWAIFSYETATSVEFGLVSFERTLTFNQVSEPVAEVREGTYDAVARIEPSPWAADILGRMPPIEKSCDFYHFAAYFSNFGSLDVIAKRIRFEPRIDRMAQLAILTQKST